MNRITVDVTKETYDYLSSLKADRGSSISFEANVLIEIAINGRIRKKKDSKISDHSADTRSGNPRR